jgi:hypothetical protein
VVFACIPASGGYRAFERAIEGARRTAEMRSAVRVFAVGWTSFGIVAGVVGCGGVVEHSDGDAGASGVFVASAGFGGSGSVATNTGGTGVGGAILSSGGRAATSDGGGGAVFTQHIDAGKSAPPPAWDAAVAPVPIFDGGPHSIAPPCFQVAAPSECGVLTEWLPTDPSGLWTLKRAYPISGSDGFASLVTRAGAESDDYLVTGPATTGCTAFASPPLPAGRHFVSIARAVSRGGTLAILARYADVSTGFTTTALFVNGKEWIDPTGVDSADITDVDVDDAGKVFVASSVYDSYADGGDGSFVVERWLSPSGAILTEGRYVTNDELVSVAVLANDHVALAYVSVDSTVSDYITFQASNFAVRSTFSVGLGNSISAVSARAPWLAVGGFTRSSSSELLVGVLDADDGSLLWQRTRSDVSPLSVGLEIDSSGTLDVTGAQTGFSSLMLHEAKASAPAPVHDFWNPTYGGRPIEPGVRTQSDGSVLWSGVFAGTYCTPQG